MAKKAKSKSKTVKMSAEARAERRAVKEANEAEARFIKEREDEMEGRHPTMQAHREMMDAIEDVSRCMKNAGVRSVHIEDDIACITETMHVALGSDND